MLAAALGLPLLLLALLVAMQHLEDRVLDPPTERQPPPPGPDGYDQLTLPHTAAAPSPTGPAALSS